MKFAAGLQAAFMDLELHVKALELPVDELAIKQELLAKKLAEVEEQHRLAGDLLAGDRKRALVFLESQVDALRQKAYAHLSNIAEELLGSGYRPGMEQEAHLVLSQAVQTLFEQELTAAAELFDEYMTGILAPHRQKADALISAVREAAVAVFAIDYQATEQETIFQMKRQPYWVKDKLQTGVAVIPHAWLESLLPDTLRLARIRKRLKQHVDALITQNVENLRWAILQNVENAFRAFSEALKVRLARAVTSTNQAVAAAAAMKNDRADVAEAELSRLRTAAQEVRQLMGRLTVLQNNQPK